MLRCASCSTSPTSKPRKKCAKCQTTLYCSRECQDKHWKAHKKDCAKFAAGKGEGAEASFGALDGPFTKLHHGTWLHDRTELDTYATLIDSFRLRLEDRYTFDGEILPGTTYVGAVTSQAAFDRFLDLLERDRTQKQTPTATGQPKQASLLPSWWNQSKREACIALGSAGHRFNLGNKVTKQTIATFYNDGQMPMEMRMFTEAVYGSGIGGKRRDSMLAAQVAMENGDLRSAQENMPFCPMHF